MFLMPIDALQQRPHPFAQLYVHGSATPVDRDLGRGMHAALFPGIGKMVTLVLTPLALLPGATDLLDLVLYVTVKLKIQGLTWVKH